MKLSRVALAASAAPSATSLPPSRRTPSTGCVTSNASSRRSAISPITESTKNGMSSLAISTTDTALRAPEAVSATVSQRIFGTPGWRSVRKS